VTHPDGPPCVAGACTRPAAPGILLCVQDAARLGDWIARIGDEFAQLDATPSMQGREVGTVGGTTLTSQRSVGNLDVMALRADRRGDGTTDVWGWDDTPSVLETLGSWARLVREQRGIEPDWRWITRRRAYAPTGPWCDDCDHATCVAWRFDNRVYVPATVSSERRLLAGELEWILTQDWVDEFYDAIRSLWSAVRRVNDPGGSNGPRCGCGGRIRLAAGTATCSACGTSTSGLDIVRQQTAGAAA